MGILRIPGSFSMWSRTVFFHLYHEMQYEIRRIIESSIKYIVQYNNDIFFYFES